MDPQKPSRELTRQARRPARTTGGELMDPQKPSRELSTWEKLREAILLGLVTAPKKSRNNPHSRIFTKSYADGRQRKGGKLYRLQQKRLARNQKA